MTGTMPLCSVLDQLIELKLVEKYSSAPEEWSESRLTADPDHVDLVISSLKEEDKDAISKNISSTCPEIGKTTWEKCESGGILTIHMPTDAIGDATAKLEALRANGVAMDYNFKTTRLNDFVDVASEQKQRSRRLEEISSILSGHFTEDMKAQIGNFKFENLSWSNYSSIRCFYRGLGFSTRRFFTASWRYFYIKVINVLMIVAAFTASHDYGSDKTWTSAAALVTNLLLIHPFWALLEVTTILSGPVENYYAAISSLTGVSVYMIFFHRLYITLLAVLQRTALPGILMLVLLIRTERESILSWCVCGFSALTLIAWVLVLTPPVTRRPLNGSIIVTFGAIGNLLSALFIHAACTGARAYALNQTLPTVLLACPFTAGPAMVALSLAGGLSTDEKMDTGRVFFCLVGATAITVVMGLLLLTIPPLFYKLHSRKTLKSINKQVEKIKATVVVPAGVIRDSSVIEEEAAAAAPECKAPVRFFHACCTRPDPDGGALIPAVQDLSLVAREGECLAIIGPNGAGKTTALALALKQIPTTAGGVQISAKRVGWVPQHTHCGSDLTVECLVESFALLVGMDRKMAKIVAIKCGLGAMLKRKTQVLSGGYKRRLQLALALISSGELLIADEIAAGVDVQAQKEIHGLMATMCRAGMTILMTSHHLDAVEHLADRLAVLSGGVLATTGTTAAIAARYPIGICVAVDVVNDTNARAVIEWVSGLVHCPPEHLGMMPLVDLHFKFVLPNGLPYTVEEVKTAIKDAEQPEWLVAAAVSDGSLYDTVVAMSVATSKYSGVRAVKNKNSVLDTASAPALQGSAVPTKQEQAAAELQGSAEVYEQWEATAPEL